MAIYHLRAKTGSRQRGHSARAKADYIQREGKYRAQEDRLTYKESGHMPAWAEAQPNDYWRAADTYERRNGRLFKEVEFALPKELPSEGQIALTQRFAAQLTEANRLPYTLAIHEGKGENPHAHLMISERANDGVARSRETWFRRANSQTPEVGGAAKTDSLKPKAWLFETRAAWAVAANQALEREGIGEHIDHRSLAEQGVDRIPTKHIGVGVLAMEARGVRTERVDQALEVERLNRTLERERQRELGLRHEGSSVGERSRSQGLEY